MKKLTALLLAALMVVSMAACSGDTGSDNDVYTVGIIQYMEHASLDLATQGFMDALTEILGEENVEFDNQNAGGEFTNCGTIVDGFVASGVDLIMANATPALQAAASATADIPIMGTSVTDYASALGISDWTGTIGRNISGTSDLAPLDQQAAVLAELFPDAKTVGLLYCSAEPNSIYQVNVVAGELTGLGYEPVMFAFNDANDLAAVTQSAVDACDVLYVPTDNVAAEYCESIGNVVLPANKPLITGESNTCAVCGVATLSIDYYDLGYLTGQMAAKVLTGEADITTMAIQNVTDYAKMYNPDVCASLNITVPEGYDPIN